MRSCFVADAEVQHGGSHSLSASGAPDAFFRTMESKGTSHHWWHVASGWWRKNRSSFYKGFMTGLCVVWFLGGSATVLAVLSGLYTFATNFSWHAKVKGGPMLPLHR